ncbi:unnamed protein product [Nippostrongylus brasiliensis]|uniref:Alpha/beta hydrolase n=1 Tax=Nippostrongylus brasiliensis TaxID=27835 RepID=A0A0N4Y2B8_NIPBR|nr:unnamed protein product [Nippostrongylus brasiliensis]
MSSLSLRAPMEQIASAPTQESMPRQIEEIPDDVLIAYARRRLEAREPKRMSVGRRYDFATQVTRPVFASQFDENAGAA